MKNLTFLDSVKQMPLFELPVRSTVVHLDQAVVLISSGSQLTKDQLKSAGAVTDIVAPNLLHTAGLAQAIEVFPQARVWKSLTAEAWPYQSELSIVNLKGMPKFDETVFVHKASKTLIATDLCFNLVEAKGFGSWLILNMFGTYRKFAISKLFMKYITDRDAFKKSIKQVLAYDFNHLVVGHGQTIEENAKPLFEKALKDRNLYP